MALRAIVVLTLTGSCLGSGHEDDAKEACEARSAISCSQNMLCRTLFATGFDRGRTCREKEATAIGCVAKELVCTDALTYAEDADGKVWELRNGCLPAGWTSTYEDTFVREWPLCTP